MTTSANPIIAKPKCVERDSVFVEFDLVDEHGDIIELSAISAFTYTLYAEDQQTVLFSRSVVNILNTNGGTYDETTGHVELDIPSSDNAIANTAGDDEVHYALLTLTYGADQWSRWIKTAITNLKPLT